MANDDNQEIKGLLSGSYSRELPVYDEKAERDKADRTISWLKNRSSEKADFEIELVRFALEQKISLFDYSWQDRALKELALISLKARLKRRRGRPSNDSTPRKLGRGILTGGLSETPEFDEIEDIRMFYNEEFPDKFPPTKPMNVTQACKRLVITRELAAGRIADTKSGLFLNEVQKLKNKHSQQKKRLKRGTE